jgi:hypothetical protein
MMNEITNMKRQNAPWGPTFSPPRRDNNLRPRQQQETRRFDTQIPVGLVNNEEIPLCVNCQAFHWDDECSGLVESQKPD